MSFGAQSKLSVTNIKRHVAEPLLRIARNMFWWMIAQKSAKVRLMKIQISKLLLMKKENKKQMKPYLDKN